jgi:Flp pilus assembly protein TadD
MSDLSNLALAHLGQQDLEPAVQIASEAVRECPDDWHAHYALGQCLRFTGNLSAAIEAPRAIPSNGTAGIAGASCLGYR